ncbi:MAG: hypothetical protein ACRD3Q_04980 [Terriglobales bacterium]
MGFFESHEKKQIRKLTKQTRYTTDVYRFENLGSMAWDVWNAPPNWHAMDAASDRFFYEAEDIYTTIQRPPIQTAIQNLINSIN